MDDDLTFGASVWATSEPTESDSVLKSESRLISQFDDNTFDDFDEFGEPEDATGTDLKDDDFGDFENVDTGPSTSFRDVLFEPDGATVGSSSRPWRPLHLDPPLSRSDLESQINETLGPIWNNEDLSSFTSDDSIREAEGISQILCTSSSREMYMMLLQTPPPTKPPNWTRSRIRRQHLIALGIPVNLDEVLPRANVKPLPPLEIHTRPMSAPPGSRSQYGNNSSVSMSKSNSRSGTPQPGQQGIFAQFGPKPELDTTRINKLLQLSSETLTLQPLANLERYLADIRLQTANTSNLLTYLLQSRDALQQDSETYNGLIAEMVGEAQKLKSGKPPSRMGSIRRGSGIS
ncbi:hypothetical protein JR316_0004868 [Psilocybe cubensis]|uniref:Uncharacterized protein n=1 Tax=Psilocybe cubensis TaxID=181762 RepID=A0ACB8H4D0_PSICU|nr:hypothetical protein JR316_0004868 [Psilocybe cubensis]KAH9482768.1 hypothetical protein JR316_0004868 [Psilocybe cubensis]